MMGAVQDYWGSTMQDRLTQGQSRLLRPSAPMPDLEAYGCAEIPAGTRILVQGNVVPIVSANVNGKSIKGVTLPAMVRFEETPPMRPN